MTSAKRLRFYLWDRTGMHPSDNAQAERYARKEDYDALEARYLAQSKELTAAQLEIVGLRDNRMLLQQSVNVLEAENADLRRMCLEDGK